MPNRIIIADTSSLIALSKINQLGLLKELYGEVSITTEVAKEFGERLPNWILVEKVKDKEKVALLELKLDKGESSAIAFALEQENSLLIIDERKGREAARKMGLNYTGILGVILKAKEEKVIDSVKSLIEKLERVDFRMSDALKTRVLERANEK